MMNNLKTKTPYITAVFIFLMSIALNYLLRGQRSLAILNLQLLYGVTACVLLCSLVAAWKIGYASDKAFYQSMTLSLFGILFMAFIETIVGDIRYVLIELISAFICHGLPMVMAVIAGYFTRKYVPSKVKCIYINMLPGFMMIIYYLGMLSGHFSSIEVGEIIIALLIASSTLAAAYTESLDDYAERRRYRWYCCWLLNGIVMLYMYALYDLFSFLVLSSLLRMTLPMILLRWKKILKDKGYNQYLRAFIYFAGSILINALQAGVCREMMSIAFVQFSPAWMLIGTLLALVVYWQRPVKSIVAGIAGSLILPLSCIVVSMNSHYRVFAILHGISEQLLHSGNSEWLTYRVNAIKAFVTGDFTSMYHLYEGTDNDRFKWIVDNKTIPMAFPMLLLILALILVTAYTLVKYAENKEIARIMAISLVCHGIIGLLEYAALVYDKIELPFTWEYMVEIIVMMWVLKGRQIEKTYHGNGLQHFNI